MRRFLVGCLAVVGGLVVVVVLAAVIIGTLGSHGPALSPATPTTAAAASPLVSTSAPPSFSPAATPTASAADAAYLATIRKEAQTMDDSVHRFAALAQEVNQDPSKLFDSSWKLHVVAELATWKATYDEAVALTPPPRFAAFHQTYLRALQRFNAAADDVAYGIDHLDAAAFTRAGLEVKDAQQLLQEADTQLP